MSSSGDPYQPVNPGSSIRPSARAENAKSAAAKKHANSKFGTSGGGEGGGAQALPTFFRLAGTLSEFSIVGYGTPVITPDIDPHAPQVFDAAAPISGRPFAILREPGGAGDCVEGFTTGPANCNVNVTNASHGFAVPNGSNAYLTSDASNGVPILWKAAGTGILAATVLLGPTAPGLTYTTYQGVVSGEASVANANATVAQLGGLAGLGPFASFNAIPANQTPKFLCTTHGWLYRDTRTIRISFGAVGPAVAGSPILYPTRITGASPSSALAGSTFALSGIVQFPAVGYDRNLAIVVEDVAGTLFNGAFVVQCTIAPIDNGYIL